MINRLVRIKYFSEIDTYDSVFVFHRCLCSNTNFAEKANYVHTWKYFISNFYRDTTKRVV